MDVSLSMSATDLSPSRFVVAKELITDLVAQLRPVSVSLLVFSGVPFEPIVFSSESSELLDTLDRMSIQDFPVNSEFL